MTAWARGRSTACPSYSSDPEAPNYLAPEMQRIRDFGDPEHCRLLHAANPALTIVIAHGVDDRTCPVVPKIRQFAGEYMREDGAFALAPSGDSDFTGYPTISFVKR